MQVNYCARCGAHVSEQVPDGDTRPRQVCEQCGLVHYQNPKVVVGCIVQHQDRVLLCRRGIQPRHGYWTVPAGFMENGETTYQGAVRETWEEATARVKLIAPYLTVNLPHINQVYLLFRAHLSGADFAPGIESLETALFTEAQIPWEQLAFPTVAAALRRYFADRATGHFPRRMADIAEHTDDPKGYRIDYFAESASAHTELKVRSD